MAKPTKTIKSGFSNETGGELMKSKGDSSWTAIIMGFLVFIGTFPGLMYSPPVSAATTPNVQYKEELPEIKTNVPQLKKSEEKEKGKKEEKFDHNLTGFPLRGGHAWVPCEECHIRGVFRGTPRNCRGCHTRGLGTGGSRMPANHIPTTAECDLCHTVNRLGATWNTVRMDHIGITSNCEICHNGRQAPGKNANHIPTSQPCELCHRSTLSFANEKMNHLGITSNCQNCHNNPQFPFAQGWPSVAECPNHVRNSAIDCSSSFCHGSSNFTSWNIPSSGLQCPF